MKKLLINWLKYLSISTYKMDENVATAQGIFADKIITEKVIKDNHEISEESEVTPLGI